MLAAVAKRLGSKKLVLFSNQLWCRHKELPLLPMQCRSLLGRVRLKQPVDEITPGDVKEFMVSIYKKAADHCLECDLALL